MTEDTMKLPKTIIQDTVNTNYRFTASIQLSVPNMMGSMKN